jgi:hypothetical protein
MNEMDSAGRIVEADRLDAQSVQHLLTGQALAIRVPEYCSVEAQRAALSFVRSQPQQDYEYVGAVQGKSVRIALGVKRIGTPFNSVYGPGASEEERAAYYRDAAPRIRALRFAMAPYLSPIDRLRVELDETWPQGANVGAFQGAKMFVGICRSTPAATSEAGTAPHFDAPVPGIVALERQFAANAYLSVPDAGGELELWDVEPLTAEAIRAVDMTADLRKALPPPVTLKPRVRELIVFDTRRPHAVRGFTVGDRISLQCFIGVTPDRSLVLWN